MTNADFTKELTTIEQMLREAYERGYEAGAAAMRESILKAASELPGAAKTVGQTNLSRAFGLPSGDKMPRGRTRELIDQVLREEPGLPYMDIARKVNDLDDRASPKTIYNELMRHKDERYRREGDKWFLIGDTDKGTARAGTLAELMG